MTSLLHLNTVTREKRKDTTRARQKRSTLRVKRNTQIPVFCSHNAQHIQFISSPLVPIPMHHHTSVPIRNYGIVLPRRTIQPRLPNQLPKLPPLLNQILGRIKLRHPPLIQHHNPVRVQNRVDPMRNGDDGAVRKERRPQRRLQQGVRLYVNGRCRFVEHEDVRRGEERPSKGYELTLTL
ncbi:hypothetical protein HYALB_00001489 [Hymenoscyphus albidus]|uniref:Uncharacterized protein n=1 Tax=Hymenoscyphus albidus TaxID=595503 RepID=A0A9N9PPY9_9HELO|nr:hypothetical protein HYALB_00001489 [Hymenoscyphus albidus]